MENSGTKGSENLEINTSNPIQSKTEAKPTSDLSYKVTAGIFLTSVAGFGFLAGFGGSLAATKKQGNEIIVTRYYFSL
jgi:hypothetical protein